MKISVKMVKYIGNFNIIKNQEKEQNKIRIIVIWR